MTRKRRSAEAVLERRYRRLLAWYPAAYRTANGEEMLGVAMAGAKPGQRRPGWAETVSLVRSALRRRAAGLLPDVRSPAWRDAGTVLILLGPAVLAAANIWALASRSLPGSGFPGAMLAPAGRWVVPHVPADSVAIFVALAAGWAAVAAAAVLRWRWAAAVGASLAAAGETTRLAVRYAADPAYAAGVWWQVVLAVMTALAAISILVGEKSQARPLSRGAIAAVWSLVALLGASPLIVWGVARITGVVSLGHDTHLLYGVIMALAFIPLIVTLRLEPWVRRRVLALSIAPMVAAAASAVAVGGGLFAGGVRTTLLAPLSWLEVATLVIMPVLGLLAALVWIARHERLRPRTPAESGGR